MGVGVGRWPMEGGQRGEMGGGHQRGVWEQQKVHWFPLLGSFKNLTTGLIWLVMRVGAGKGGDGGGTREQCGSNLLGSLRPYNWSDLAGDEDGGMGGGVGRWPMEGGHKCALVP